MSVDPTVRILLEEIASERSRKRRLESLLDDVLAEKEDLMLACGLAPRAPSPSTNTIQQQQQMTTSSALAAFPTASAATATATATTTAAASPGGSITAEYEYKIVTKRQRLSFNPNNARSTFTGATPRRRANLLALSAPAMEQEGRAGTEPQPIVTFPPEASAAEPLASARATQTLPQPLSTSSPMMHSGASEQSANSPILTRITNNERVCDVTTQQQQQQQQQQQDGETTDANKEAEQTATDGAIVPTKPPLLHFPSLTLPPPRPGSFSIGLGSLGSIGSLGSFGSFSQLFDVQRRNSSSSDAALVAAAAEAVASGSMSGRKASIGRGIVANSRFSMDWSQWTDDHALCDTLTDFFDF